MKLQKQIEELISKNSDDFEVSKIIKKEINLYLNSLDSTFEKDFGKSFLVKHTKTTDYFIITMYKYIIRKYFGDYAPLINSIPITIVALGSYAREQLCVYSDIDLMIIYEKTPGYNVQEIISSFLQLAWDSSLKLGHRVHTLDDLFNASLKDHTIKTALIESRYICGSKFLWTKSENELSKIRKYNQKEYIKNKIDEFNDRKNQTLLNMQPNIKTSVGGLRDVNTLYWILNVLYGVKRIKDAVPSVIKESEYKEIILSVEFLYRVRTALHLSAKKKEDRLILELIPNVAKKFNLNEQKLIKKTFQAMLNIQVFSQILIKRLTSPLFFDKQNIKKLKNNKLYNNIFVCQNTIYTSMKPQKVNLEDILNNIIKFHHEDFKYDISFINYLLNCNLTKPNPQNFYKIVKKLFYKKYLYEIFLAFFYAKIIDKIIPPLKKVICLAQFDGYHEYPVDIHSIRTLKFLENIEDSFIKELYINLSNEEKALLKIVALCHDSGKGRKKDHSLLGSAIVKNFLTQLQFDQEYILDGALLVKYHTLMSNIANHEDIYSEKVIFSFIHKLKKPKILDLLYILTYVDINAVTKKRYSTFQANLLKELYLTSKKAFLNTKRIGEAGKREQKEKLLKKDQSFLNLNRTLKKKILSIESNLLFFKYSPTQIVNIAKWVSNLKAPYEYYIENNTHLSISIIRNQELNLGYLLAKLSNLDVVNMDIYKIFNKVKYFRVDFLEKVEPEEIFYVQEIIKNSFNMEAKAKLTKPIIFKDEIDIDCNHSQTYARMSINCKNQKGLLANIISIFDDLGIDIASAKIQTIKNRARNMFLIQKNGKFCSNEELIIKKLVSIGV